MEDFDLIAALDKAEMERDIARDNKHSLYELNCENIDLKEKIEKAIKYINENEFIRFVRTEKLLEILGEEND